MISEVEHQFIGLLDICVSYLEIMSVQVFRPCFNWIVFGLGLFELFIYFGS